MIKKKDKEYYIDHIDLGNKANSLQSPCVKKLYDDCFVLQLFVIPAPI